MTDILYELKFAIDSVNIRSYSSAEDGDEC